MINRRIVLSSLAALVAAGAGYTFLRNPKTTDPASEPATGTDTPTTTPTPESNPLVAEMSLGNPDAKVTMIEYASFTCPHCASFHKDTFKSLKADYIDTGKIHFIYREVYFDRFGLWAGMMARCAGPDKYFGMVDMIYDTQSTWTRGADNAEIIANMRKIGLLAGQTNEQLDACFANEEKAEAMVAQYQKNAEADSVTGTPSFIINGKPISNQPYASLKLVLDDLLKD